MSTKRLIQSLPKHDLNNLETIMKDKFAQGSRRKCRILDYARLESTYVCTFEQIALKEVVFTKSDLQVGQLVTAKVSGITNAGLKAK